MGFAVVLSYSNKIKTWHRVILCHASACDQGSAKAAQRSEVGMQVVSLGLPPCLFTLSVVIEELKLFPNVTVYSVAIFMS